MHRIGNASEQAPPLSRHWITDAGTAVRSETLSGAGRAVQLAHFRVRRSDSDCHDGMTVAPCRLALLLECVEVQLRLTRQVFVRAAAGTKHLQVHTPCRRIGVE